MKTVLLTGGAGFIGSHLSRLLINNNYKVIAVDNYITGSKNNISDLSSNINFTLIEHDISKPLEVKQQIDYVLHFASPASPIDYAQLPIQTLKVGALGTHNALGIAKAKHAIFLLASTSEVYGDPLVHPQTEDYWGNVNPIGVRSCFSADTEVLTEEGWKFFPDLKSKTKILTLNKNNVMTYCAPSDIIKQRYVGELIKFSNTNIDLHVTPNHKMYVKRRDSKRFELMPAFESIKWERSEMLKSGFWLGKEQKWFILPRVSNAKLKQIDRINMDLWLEFFGFFITEGYTYLGKRRQVVNNKTYDTKVYSVFISQSKKNISTRNKIRKCLQKLGLKFFEEDAQFKILSKQLYTYLEIFGKAKDKFIPREYLMLSQRQLRIMFNSMMLGEGSWDFRKYYSSSPYLLGSIQEVLLKLGMAGTVAVKDAKKGTGIVYLLKNERKDYLTPNYPKREILHYDGYVYCVTVPNNLIYVRRNGKALWCGNCYDEAKRFSEALTMAYHHEHGMNTKIVRIFNTYGPNMRKNDGRVVPNFITQALANEPLTVYGDGKQTRSFCYVSDLIDGIYRLMLSNYNQPVNIGNPHELTILDFAKKIKEIIGTKGEIVHKPLPIDDPKTRCPDISKAKSILGWEPVVNVDDGLKKTIEWFKAN